MPYEPLYILFDVMFQVEGKNFYKINDREKKRTI